MRLLRLLLCCALCAFAVAASAATVVRYPRFEPEGTEGWYTLAHRYSLEVLAAALARSGHAYDLQPASQLMSQGRLIEQLRFDAGVDVIWTMTTGQRERQIEPIRVPLYKGLMGWRVLLVRKADLPKFAAIRSVDELKRLVALQGHDWPDTAILRANGFRVMTGAYYHTFFEMLANGRVDYFPRGVVEAYDELRAHPDLDLAVEPTLLIRYPTALYFFVRKGNTRLAEDLRKGMDVMVADGTFDRLFHRHHEDYLKQAGLKQRRVFDLPNPLLPPATPLGRKELWRVD